jgi:hypothetical protein
MAFCAATLNHFKFASRLGYSDVFSSAGYSEMKSKLIRFLRYDDNGTSLR